MEKYTVKMAQESYWDMEVEAESEIDALVKALTHANDGERVAKDEDREWDDFRALSATLSSKKP